MADDIDRSEQAIEARREQREARIKAETSEQTKRRRLERKGSAQLEGALKSVQVGDRPDLRGLPGLATVQAVDPYDEKKAPKIISLKNDPLLLLHVKNTIDEVQLKSGRAYQRYWYDAEIGGAQAIDYSVDRVDGGQLNMSDDQRKLDALERLRELDAVLGKRGANLCRMVLGHGHTLAIVAHLWGCTEQTRYRALRIRFTECLDDIAVEMGYAPDRPARGPVRKADEFDALAQHRDSPRLFDAVKRAREA